SIQVAGSTLWIAAERLALFRSLWPELMTTPQISAPPGCDKPWSSDEGLVEILRGRLEGLGPVTPTVLASPLGLQAGEIAAGLAALQTQGFAMCGRFTAGAGDEEWCERRLLARIHHYTIKRLRAEIEPVAARDFIRFLLEWQRLDPAARMEGPDALESIVAQLEGFEAAAGAWETELLPARVADYEPAWLDDLCRAGQVAWARLRPRTARANGAQGRPAPVRTTPITLLPRRHARHWVSLKSHDAEPGARAALVAQFIAAH